jgi:hypothetical protein
MKPQDLMEALRLVREHEPQIRAAWSRHFGRSSGWIFSKFAEIGIPALSRSYGFWLMLDAVTERFLRRTFVKALRSLRSPTSKHGFWLMLDGTERFLAFELFPWFRDATIGQITEVELVAPGHLRWPSMDIDLALDSIDRPDEYPLVSKTTTFAKG